MELRQEVEALREKLEAMQGVYARTIVENKFLKQELTFRRQQRTNAVPTSVRLSAA